MPNPVYSSHPKSRLVKRRPVPTAGEQCGCTMLRELARRVANSSHSVVPSARNSVLRSSNMKICCLGELRTRVVRMRRRFTMPNFA